MAIAPLVASPPFAADEGVRQVLGVLDRCGAVRELSATAATRLIGDVDRAVARLQSMKLAAISVVDRADVASHSGMTGTAAWLAARGRIDSASAARDVKLAAALDEGLDATRAALADGDLTAEHARIIARAVDQLPPCLKADERDAIESALAVRARTVDPPTLGRVARRALEAANRSQAEVDAHEDQQLRSEEQAALAKTRLSLHDNGDGTLTGRFTVPSFAGNALKKVIQQIASPRRFAAQAAKRARSADEQVRAATWEAFRAEDLTWEQKYGRAFVELLEHLPTDKLSGKVNATLVVTLDLEKLRAGVGAAHLDTGCDLSASEARRLACGAGIVPAVLDGRSQVLDLGRTERFFTEAQRVALATRYQTCAAEDCDRPYAWTEMHHEDPWALGGRTDQDKAVPLCGHHHRCVHDPAYRHSISTDRLGRKTVSFVRRS